MGYEYMSDGINWKGEVLDADGINFQSRYTAEIPEGTSNDYSCLLYTSPSPRDVEESRMPSSA